MDPRNFRYFMRKTLDQAKLDLIFGSDYFKYDPSWFYCLSIHITQH